MLKPPSYNILFYIHISDYLTAYSISHITLRCQEKIQYWKAAGNSSARTSHYAAKSVRKHSDLDASSHGSWL